MKKINKMLALFAGLLICSINITMAAETGGTKIRLDLGSAYDGQKITINYLENTGRRVQGAGYEQLEQTMTVPANQVVVVKRSDGQPYPAEIKILSLVTANGNVIFGSPDGLGDSCSNSGSSFLFMVNHLDNKVICIPTNG